MTRIALAALLVALSPLSSGAADWPALVRELSHKVVRVEILAGEDKGICTGVIVNAASGYVVTAAHCVSVPPNTKLDVTVNKRDAAVIRYNRLIDLAVLKIEPRSADAEMPLAETTPPVGTEVAILGFAFGHKGMSVQFGRVSMVLDDDGEQMRVDGMIVPGDSGGPLVDMEGRLVGVSSAIWYAGPSHMAALVPIETVREYVGPYLPAKK